MSGKDIANMDLRQVAWADLLRTHAHLVRVIDAELVGKKLLPLDWYDVLLTLARAKGQKLKLSELADRVFLSRSGLTRLVDRLETAGLLARERCEDDRRVQFATLRPAAHDALQKTWPVYESLINEHFGRHMTDDDASVLHGVFSRVAPPPPEISEPVQVGILRRN